MNIRKIGSDISKFFFLQTNTDNALEMGRLVQNKHSDIMDMFSDEESLQRFCNKEYFSELRETIVKVYEKLSEPTFLMVGLLAIMPICNKMYGARELKIPDTCRKS